MLRSLACALVLTAAPPLPGAADPLEAIFVEAARALAAGDLAAAERGFQAVLDKSPNHVGALGNLGVVYSRMDRPAEAVAVYSRALRVAPGEPGLLLNLGLAHLKLEDYARAKPLFAKLVQRGFATSQTSELLATCEVFTGEHAAAVARLEKLPRTPGTLFLLGIGYLKNNERAKAEAAFQQLLASSASPAQAQYLLGKAYLEGALAEQAAAAFRQALELDPNLPGLRLELGKAHLSLRDHPSAERELRAALRDKPNDADASYYLGALLVLESRAQEAIPLLERARAARPDGWGAYYYLGRARLQARDHPAAIAMLEKAATLNPNDAAVLYQLARAYRAAGRAADAANATEQVRRLRDPSRAAEESVVSPR